MSLWLCGLKHDVMNWSGSYTRIKDALPGDVARVGTEYHLASYFADDAKFSASDAISLALLKLREQLRLSSAVSDDAKFYHAGRNTFYALALKAVRSALALSEPTLIEEVVVSRSFGKKHEKALAQLLIVRLRLVSFQDEWGALLEGDPWGVGNGDLSITSEQRQAVEKARAWYVASADRMMQELSIVDSAICTLVGWDLSRRTAFSELLQHHGFPDVQKFADEFQVP